MKKNFIIKMLDGGIRDISTDTWCERRGCETCGYGGWHKEYDRRRVYKVFYRRQ